MSTTSSIQVPTCCVSEKPRAPRTHETRACPLARLAAPLCCFKNSLSSNDPPSQTCRATAEACPSTRRAGQRASHLITWAHPLTSPVEAVTEWYVLPITHCVQARITVRLCAHLRLSRHQNLVAPVSLSPEHNNRLSATRRASSRAIGITACAPVSASCAIAPCSVQSQAQ